MAAYMTGAQRSRIEASIEPHMKDGEDVADCVERLIRERDVATYDRSVVENARDERRQLRMMFAAAILSHPDQKLKIDEVTLKSLDMAKDSIVSTADPATRETFFFVIRGK